MMQDKKKLGIKALQHLGAVLFFLFATVVYFSPEFFDGKELSQHDVNQFQGSSQDIREYYEKDGASSAWTGGMFSGMPAYQIGIWGGSPNFLNYLEAPLKALGNTTAGPVFAGMLMAYLLFLILGFSIPMAMFGAIAYSLSSYNIIILHAGHVTKAWALAYMPIVVGGVLCMFKNKYLLGGICMALGLALQIKSNHLQMTYYTGILCAIFYIGLVVKRVKNEEFPSLIKSSLVLLVAVVLALAANAGNIYGNYEMSKTSTRGKSELTAKETGQKSEGLDKDYVFGWSYGKAETFSLLIPNIHGGGSASKVDPESSFYKTMQNAGYPSAEINKMGGLFYWGDQPGTSGPVYFGAIVCFLFLLGMFIIRNPFKWLLLGATVFFIFLSWGKNFEFFNDLFFNYFPLYTKFRAVSQALVIPALLMVIGAVWAVKEFFSGELKKEQLLKSLYISSGIIVGICLLLWAVPGSFFNFKSANDGGLPPELVSMILADRKSMLSSDALRSLIFVLLAFVTLWYSLKKEKAKNMSICAASILALLTLGDLWGVDKRYLGDDKFSEEVHKKTFEKTKADEVILKDTENYRVFNLSNPFNETSTSYFHRSIGGYHAAKLQRYQQLIENRLYPEMMNISESFQTQDIEKIVAAFEKNPTLNMLNTRYIIFDDKQPPLANPYALGNAWFVDSYQIVENADAEIAALNALCPGSEAVIDKRYSEQLQGLDIKTDSLATIQLTAYKPDVLTYKTKVDSEQLAVFSEIFYANGWNAYLDGQVVPHFCANWTLRAMRIPAGEHEIVFKFEPTGYYNSRMLATASSALLILLLLGTIIFQFTRKPEDQK